MSKKIVLALSAFVFIYWFIIYLMAVNVYKFALTGAVFELLWLPMLSLPVVLLTISIIQLSTEKFTLKSFPLYSIIFLLLTVLMVVFF